MAFTEEKPYSVWGWNVSQDVARYRRLHFSMSDSLSRITQ
jgi:hypothetical protein